MLFWHVPAPNEALLISGSRRKSQETQFRIVTGHGTFVVPIKQKARFLSLSLRESEIAEECITTQGIRLHVRAIAAFKVGDDPVSIANAARRFLSEQNRMEELVGRIFAGHLRSIIGSLTVEEIIRERDRLAQEVKDGSHGEMEKLGIVVDSLQIQEIEDATGYINNIAAPHAAAVASLARIGGQGRPGGHPARAGAAALKAQYMRDTRSSRPASRPKCRKRKRRPPRPARWPRARPPRRSSPSRRRSPSAMRQLTEKQLESEVRRPADAEAYKTRTLADAEPRPGQGRDRGRGLPAADHRRGQSRHGQLRDRGRGERVPQDRRGRCRGREGSRAEAADATAKHHEADGDAYAQRTVAAAEAEGHQHAGRRPGRRQPGAHRGEQADRGAARVGASGGRGDLGSHLTVLNGARGRGRGPEPAWSRQGLAIYESLRHSIPNIAANGATPPTGGDGSPALGAGGRARTPPPRSRPTMDRCAAHRQGHKRPAPETGVERSGQP